MMEKMVAIPSDMYRTDPITGTGNILAFFEWLNAHTQSGPIPPYSLISLDIRNLYKLNEANGQLAGDAAVRWASFVLKEEAEAQVYRLSGDEFIGVLIGGDFAQQDMRFGRVIERLEREAEQVQLTPPAALVAMIHYSGGEKTSPENLLKDVYGSLYEVKSDPKRSFKIFNATDVLPAANLSGSVDSLVVQLVSLGKLLDESIQLAFIDIITGLPNMVAATQYLERAISTYQRNTISCSVLLIDGDDLGRYNSVSYLMGDEMIANLSRTMMVDLRPRDFLARWRTGDEFLIALPDTGVNEAAQVAERFSTSIREISKSWTFPVTVSVGITELTETDIEPRSIIHRVENALKRAKEKGKDRVEIES